LAAVLPAIVLLGIAAGAYACDTPVYAYTMQMWAPDAYRVFYFHDGAESPTDREVNLLLAEAAADPNREVNLRFESVGVGDLSGSGPAATVWKRNSSRKLPCHVVVSPRGFEIASERLTASSAKALFRSPKRQKLAELLCEGKHGVMLMLLGPNGEENASAQANVKAAAAEAAAGGADMGYLEVRRDDPGEKWFVRQMLAVEDDLKDLSAPMLFGVFGRGHIIEPFVGRGISHDNMLELAAFMGGPCSCEVKETAPGTDLLMACNWDQASVSWTPGQGYAEIPYMEVPAEPADAPPAPPPADKPAKAPTKAPTKPASPAAAPKAPPPPPQAAAPARAKRLAASPTPPPPPAAATRRDDAARGPKLPPPDVAAVKPAETQAAALAQAVSGPSLPDAPATAAVAEPRPSFASRLSAPLGIAVGVLTFGVVLGGLALMWVKREQA
jgi:hypothetical protein